jgi:hypothetical protein
MVTTCTELTAETTATDWLSQCVDNIACEQLSLTPTYDDPAIPCGSSMEYQDVRDYIGSCDDWQAAGSPIFTVPAKEDGASCAGGVECLSNNCVGFGVGNSVCADPCTTGVCSAGFACMGGYCFPTRTPSDGGPATLRDRDYCKSNAGAFPVTAARKTTLSPSVLTSARRVNAHRSSNVSMVISYWHALRLEHNKSCAGRTSTPLGVARERIDRQLGCA